MYSHWVNQETKKAYEFLTLSYDAHHKILPLLVRVLGMSNSSEMQLQRFFENQDSFIDDNFKPEDKQILNQINLGLVDLKQILFVYCVGHARERIPGYKPNIAL